MKIARRRSAGSVFLERSVPAVLFLIWTALCAGFGLLPEIIMYFTYGMIAPQDFWQKFAVIVVFWLGGVGLCVFFGFLFFALWVSGLAAWNK